ncbi:putative pentatricopeptide repeat-containing protein At1g69350, mitochondrial [Phoenix dactylifera]|uniref:Pentatricopeptide repeat-containing protein At1g69350, mitochondrial n=1 Tax=Phoenix dactylifera TaxID=42345 RepID=A0A8B7BLK1_PHODC|nr:putative pentatricopeptide repeat-containing protein At1g69350, mitochondrial [Phoenix dactylifera]
MTRYIPLFRSCTTKRALLQVHAHLLTTGFHRDPLAATKLIESYAMMGCIDAARLVFDKFSRPDSFMWGVMIRSYAWARLFKEVMSLYHDMQSRQLWLTCFVFPSVLRACSGLGNVRIGRKIHGRIIKGGFESDAAVETSLLQMYGGGGGGSLEDARQVFDGMPARDVVAWSSMVSSCIRCKRADIGLEIFSEMNMKNIVPDSVTMLDVTQACAELGFLKQARSVHGYIARGWTAVDEPLENSLIAMYGRCGCLDYAEKLFRNASRRSVVSWTAMISCYNEKSCYREALGVFTRMLESEVEPNSVTMMSVLFSCTRLGFLREGKSVHGFILRRSMDPESSSTGTALIDMYASFRKLGTSCNVFEAIQKKTAVSWNSLIAVCSQNGSSNKALRLFIGMQKEGLPPDSFTLSSTLPACGHVGDLSLGFQVHGLIAKTGFQLNRFVHNSLIDMYCKCGSTDTAYRIFEEIEGKDTVTWNAMMSGFCQKGYSAEAIRLFDQMYSKGIQTDAVTFLSAIQACTHLGYLRKGRWIHHKLITSGSKKDIQLETALISLYAKCGDLYMARKVFDNISQKNVVSWSSIISGYGVHGLAEDALALFSQMVASGIRPNEVTFMSILSACGHAGLVEEGLFYFDLMRQEFGVEPQLEHYACVVDLLSRAGDVDRAYKFIKSMLVEPDASIWRSLLNGCGFHHRENIVGNRQRRINNSSSSVCIIG